MRIQMTRRVRATATAVLVAAGFTLTACSAGETSTPIEDPGIAAEELVSSVEAELGDTAEYVTSISSPDPGHIQIQSNLDAAAAEESAGTEPQAVAVCEAAAGVDGVESVAVTEADGTPWVLYGDSRVPDGECAAL